jgi:hypothetical protein
MDITIKSAQRSHSCSARLFADVHAALEHGRDALAGEELLLRAYGRLLVLHAESSP